MSTSYAIRHLTRFTYSCPVSESVMELRMRPASEGPQRCLQFEVELQPRARVFAYRDALGNWVHHFDLPRRHGQLSVTARAHVLVDAAAARPPALGIDAWPAIDRWVEDGTHWDFRQPSRYAEWTPALLTFADSIAPPEGRAVDPLTAVGETMTAIHRAFEYAPQSTRVDSPIDEALAARRGVCQDFTHIMLAVLRRRQLPCRYVSGYLAPGDAAERTAMSVATHAWVEVLLPELGWIGVDPTNGVEAGPRHIRVAIGRDYADVPPTRGVFKGGASSTLAVSVEIVPGADLPPPDPRTDAAARVEEVPSAPADDEVARRQGAQQQ